MVSRRAVRHLAVCLVALTATSSATYAQLASSLISDGRLGPAGAYFSDDWHQFYINTDNGVLYRQFSNYPWEELPSPPKRIALQPTGAEIMVFDFTEFSLAANVRVWVVGSRPAAILSRGDISIGGMINPRSHFYSSLVYANGGIGGTRPDGNFGVGLAGSSPPFSTVAAGGGGGSGPGYVFTAATPWGWDLVSGGGGGGGGGAVVGANGQDGIALYTGSQSIPGGTGGASRSIEVLQGGGGGGQGGYATTWHCCWIGAQGGNGGAAVLFATPGDLIIASTGLVQADGVEGRNGNGDAGAGGGGGGGELRFLAGGAFRNFGVITARGGPGGNSENKPGSDGGGGGGGRVVIGAGSLDELGVIDTGNGAVITGSSQSAMTSLLGAGDFSQAGPAVTANPTSESSVTFASANTPGLTIVLGPSATPIGGGLSLTVPNVSPLAYYDVSTTVEYAPPVDVCFAAIVVDDQETFARVRVYHLENGLWMDRTIVPPAAHAPDFATRRVCARVDSLSPFAVALAGSPAQAWSADYRNEYDFVRSTGDTILDGVYQFQHTWRFGVRTDQHGGLHAPTITVTPAPHLLPLTPDSGPATLIESTPRIVWRGPDLPPSGGFETALVSTVPVWSSLGYDMVRSLAGGPNADQRVVAAGATETRTFAVTVTPRDVSLTRLTDLGVTIAVRDVPFGTPGPVSATVASCAADTGTLQIDASQRVHWQASTPSLDPLALAPHTVSCELVLTNTSALDARYSPDVVVSGGRATRSVEPDTTALLITTDAAGSPADPLGTVQFDVTPTDPPSTARLTSHFVRTAHFDAENRALCPTIALSPASLLNGLVGTPYQLQLSASGGTAPYAFSLMGGVLPPGLVLGANGVIAGTPSAPGVFTVSVRARDANGCGGIKSHVLVVDRPNEAPIATITGTAPGQPGGQAPPFTISEAAGPLMVSANASDPDGNTPLTFQWSVGLDGGNAAGVFVSPTTGPSASYRNQDGPSTVTLSVTVADTLGATTTRSATAHVVNVAPQVTIAPLPPSSPVPTEGTPLVRCGTFFDPGPDAPWTVQVNYGDGSGLQSLPVSVPGSCQPPAGSQPSGWFTLAHTYAENGVYTIAVTVRDKDGGASTATVPVTVRNAAPMVTGVSGSSAPLPIGSQASVSVSYTDPGALDTHACTFAWDDAGASASAGSGSGMGSCSGTHTYATPGVYAVTITVTDDDGGTAIAKWEYVVVYDPNGGFVTGGGHVAIPAGAFAANPLLTGRATVGFVSRYQRGDVVPSGQTEMQFAAAGLTFKSSSYEWLVVSGAAAQFVGTGTVNGIGDYRLLVTVVDGSPDRVRIRITDRPTGEAILDTAPGSALDSLPTLPLSGGNIVVHDR